MTTLAGRFIAKAQQIGLRRAITRAGSFAMRRLGLTTLPPYEYVQRHVQRNLHTYLGTITQDIRFILIVGAHLGHEVPDMLRRFDRVIFRLLEPSPRYIEALNKRFADEYRVGIEQVAASDVDGEATFYETNLEGSGSLLKVGDLAAQSYGMTQRESYVVQTRRLDEMYGGSHPDSIDCLWIDVQGAELNVLRGAERCLAKTHSVFLEVSTRQPLYQGAATMRELDEFLYANGFRLAALGTDWNGTGNAFYLRATPLPRPYAQMKWVSLWSRINPFRQVR